MDSNACLPESGEPTWKQKHKVVFAALSIEPVSAAVAEIYGTVRRSLELKGQNIDDNDLWIAASALLLGATLLSNDNVFSRVPGLVLEDWTT